jgi:hypothetical protein
VGNLVKCRTAREFDLLKEAYEEEFVSVTDASRGQLLDKTLRKAGLCYADHKITIVNRTNWDPVSIWKRVDLRMPTTTNSLEGTHSHLNEAITRQNPFWQSLALLVDAIGEKTQHFHAALAHDFRAAVKRSHRRVQAVPAERMHLSACYRARLPCSHRYAMGTTKVRPAAAFQWATALSTQPLEYSEDIQERTQQDAPPERLDWPKHYAIAEIRKFSRARDPKAIRRVR